MRPAVPRRVLRPGGDQIPQARGARPRPHRREASFDLGRTGSTPHETAIRRRIPVAGRGLPRDPGRGLGEGGPHRPHARTSWHRLPVRVPFARGTGGAGIARGVLLRNQSRSRITHFSRSRERREERHLRLPLRSASASRPSISVCDFRRWAWETSKPPGRERPPGMQGGVRPDARPELAAPRAGTLSTLAISGSGPSAS